MSRRKRKRLLRRALFSLVPLVVALLGAEIAARIVAPAEIPQAGPGIILMAHPTRMWALEPGKIINAFGASARIGRDGLRRSQETGADLRVLTVGDSSVFGHGVDDDDTLHARLQAALGARGVQADVLCGGVPGYSTEQSLVLLDELGWDLEPDLLVIGSLWSDNNVEPFVDREWMDQLSGRGQTAERLLNYSQAWRWLRSRDAAETTLPVGWIRAPYPDGRRRVPLSDYAANLDRTLQGAAERDVGAIFLAPSNRMRLEGALSEFGWDPYLSAMHAVASRRGVPVVDSLDALQAAGATPDAAFLDAMHPVGETNGLYADALAEALLAAGWPTRPLIPNETEPWDTQLEDPWTP